MELVESDRMVVWEVASEVLVQVKILQHLLAVITSKQKMENSEAVVTDAFVLFNLNFLFSWIILKLFFIDKL